MTEVISWDLCHAGVDIRSTFFEGTASSCAGAFWQSGADVCTDGPAIMADGVLKVWISFTDSREISSADSPKTCEKKFLLPIRGEQRCTPISTDVSDSGWLVLTVWAVFAMVYTADSPIHIVLVLDAWLMVVLITTIHHHHLFLRVA